MDEDSASVWLGACCSSFSAVNGGVGIPSFRCDVSTGVRDWGAFDGAASSSLDEKSSGPNFGLLSTGVLFCFSSLFFFCFRLNALALA